MGQVMPLVLIGLPLMAACEYFFRRKFSCHHSLSTQWSSNFEIIADKGQPDRTATPPEMYLLSQRILNLRPRSSIIPIEQKADFSRESYEDSPWFKTSTWLTMIIILGATAMVLYFVAKQADALNFVRLTLFPVVFTLCFVLFSFGIFAMLAQDVWPEKRSFRWANGFLAFWAIATTGGMLLAVLLFWSLGFQTSQLFRESYSDGNTLIAAIMVASAAAVFLLYAVLCVCAGCLISRRARATTA